MLDSGVVGLALGLTLMYFLLSLVCSGIHEVVEAVLRRRAKYLEAGISDLLGGVLKNRLYEHPTVKALYPQRGRPKADPDADEKARRKPSYIPARAFSQALLSIFLRPTAKLTQDVGASSDTLQVDSTLGLAPDDSVQVENETMLVTGVADITLTVARGQGTTGAAAHARGAPVTAVLGALIDTAAVVQRLNGTLNQLPAGGARDALAGFILSAQDGLDDWRRGAEAWFDEKMDRVSGWYARHARWWLFLYAIVLVFVVNADTVVFARTLWTDDTLREAIVAQAQSVASDSNGTTDPCEDPSCVADRLKDVQELGLPLGWPDYRIGDWDSGSYLADERVPHNRAEGVLKFLGLLLTAAALTMGAPFWFDLLNKVTNLRATGPPPKRAEEAGSEAT